MFHEFLNSLKRSNNLPMMEAIENGYSVLFESNTITQALNGREAKSPFFKMEQRFTNNMVRKFLENEEYHFPNTGDKRIPYEGLDSKFLNIFTKWVTWNVLENLEHEHDKILKEIQEYVDKIRYLDPNQLDMFGYTPEEARTAYMSRIIKASNQYLKENEKDYHEEIKKVLFTGPEESIYDPEEDMGHSGDTAGWGEEQWSAMWDYYDDPWYRDGVEAFSNFLWVASNKKEIGQRFKDPTYHEDSAYNDAESLNNDNLQKTIDVVNKEFDQRGKEEYEEAEPVVKTEGNFVWVDAGTDACSEEGRRMDHCGNTYGPDKEEGDELWSLREGEEPDDWDSHITVVINERVVPGKRVIKQIKGESNTKPGSEYHPHIIKLLTSKDPRTDNWIVDGFYTENYHAPSSNFQLSDLDEEQKALVHNIRPELFKGTKQTTKQK